MVVAFILRAFMNDRDDRVRTECPTQEKDVSS